MIATVVYSIDMNIYIPHYGVAQQWPNIQGRDVEDVMWASPIRDWTGHYCFLTLPLEQSNLDIFMSILL